MRISPQITLVPLTRNHSLTVPNPARPPATEERSGGYRHARRPPCRCPAAPAVDEDKPRAIVSRPSTGDKIFRAILRRSGWSVFVITGLILVFLIVRAAKAFKFMGFGFLTTQAWIIYSPQHFGIAAILPLGVLIALIAMVIAVPTGIAIALYISEYSPLRLRRAAGRADRPDGRDPVDHLRHLGTALPRAADPRLRHAGSAATSGFIPIFDFRLSTLDAVELRGLDVHRRHGGSLMVIPIITSLSRAGVLAGAAGRARGRVRARRHPLGDDPHGGAARSAGAA